MYFIVLGAAAGGGLPQWNCKCVNCESARKGLIPQMSQSSLAVSVNKKDWCLLNASPDVRYQLMHQALCPSQIRHSPIKSIFLTNGDIDHILGLLILREQTSFQVFSTKKIINTLTENSLLNVLNPNLVEFNNVVLEQEYEVLNDLFITPFSVPGKEPLYLEKEIVKTNIESDQTIGLKIRNKNKVSFYIPGCSVITDRLYSKIKKTELLFFDGTLFSNNEMLNTHTSKKTGLRMGHISISGVNGSIAKLKNITAKKIFIHINNTNPVINPNTPQRQWVLSQGWQVGYDGMEVQI